MLCFLIIGGLLFKVVVLCFCCMFLILIFLGVVIFEGFDIMVKMLGNVIVEDVVMVVCKSVEEGKMISELFVEIGVFFVMVCQMINVGEQMGVFDQMFLKIVDFYEDEVDIVVDGLIKFFELIMIIVFGVIIGVIVVVMYLLMYFIFLQIN